jgi:hypothetical protein
MKKFGWINVKGRPLVHDEMFGGPVLASPGERGGWMSANRRELDEVPEAGPLGSLDKPRLPLDQALIDGREQQGSLNAGQCGVQRVGGVEVRAHELGASLPKVAGSGGILDHRPDWSARGQQGVDDQAAVCSGRTGDEDHRADLRE